MKSKNYFFFAAVVVIALIGGAVFFLTSNKSKNPSGPSLEEQNVIALKPEDIGLGLELSNNNREVLMTLTKLDGIKSIEFEASYDVNETDPESGDNIVVSQGATGEVVVEGEGEVTREITLGTCSAVCRYHDVASDIKFILRVNFTDGRVGQVEDTLTYPLDE